VAHPLKLHLPKSCQTDQRIAVTDVSDDEQTGHAHSAYVAAEAEWTKPRLPTSLSHSACILAAASGSR